ncbi:hypothetical protein D9M72_400800 [compost metagenome]
MLAVGVFNPAEDPFEVVREPVLAFTDGPDTGFVNPAAEIGGGGNVGAAGDYTVGHLRRCPFQVGQEPSQCGLGGNSVAVAPWQGGRDLEGRGHRGLPPLEPEGCPGAGPFFDGARLKFSPWIVKVHPGGLGQCFHLIFGQERRVIVRMSFRGKSTALDRVGEDDGGPGGIDLFVSVEQQSDVVSAEITYCHSLFCGGERTEQGFHGGGRTAGAQAVEDLQVGRAEQSLVFLVGHGLQPAV